MSMAYIYEGTDEATGDVTWAMIQYSDANCAKSYSKIVFTNAGSSACSTGALSYAIYVTSYVGS